MFFCLDIKSDSLLKSFLLICFMNRLAFITDCLYNSAGMERVLTVCANALSDMYDITIITAFQHGRPDYYQLSDNITRYDLQIAENVSGKQKKLNYKNVLASYLRKERYDIVVSLGGMDFDFLYGIKDGSKKIVWFHFAIDIAETTWAGPNPSALRRIKSKLQTWKRIYHARQFDKIVVVSKADLKKWERFTHKALCIYNPITITNSKLSARTEKSVISVGRLDFQKGYDYLINAWQLVASKHSEWHLNIFGEGNLRGELQSQIDRLGLSNSITLCGRTSRIEEEYVKHSIFVLSSRAEGFGLVLVEAASCGLPLVSFDCPSGPSELVLNGKNGFLVDKVGDVSEMARCICNLIEDEELRKKMGVEAQEFSKLFHIENTVPQWNALFASVNS